MKKLHNNNGYKITDRGGWYYITIASTDSNQFRGYEYDAVDTIQEVEQELKNHTFGEIVKLYEREDVYLDYVEEMY